MVKTRRYDRPKTILQDRLQPTWIRCCCRDCCLICFCINPVQGRRWWLFCQVVGSCQKNVQVCRWVQRKIFRLDSWCQHLLQVAISITNLISFYIFTTFDIWWVPIKNIKSLDHSVDIMMNSFGVQLGYTKPQEMFHTSTRQRNTTTISAWRVKEEYSLGMTRL